MQPPRVFLSYCHENQAEVAKLRDDLLAAGAEVWWDQDLLPGQDWQFEIRAAIERSDAFVVCFSKESQAKSKAGIYPELRRALDIYRELPPGSVFILPVRLSGCQIPRLDIDGARSLDGIHYINLYPQDRRPRSLDRLLQAIRTIPVPSHPEPADDGIAEVAPTKDAPPAPGEPHTTSSRQSDTNHLDREDLSNAAARQAAGTVAASDVDDMSSQSQVLDDIALALSGGGFRATLFHLGVIRYLHDAKRLSYVKRICSVSGGSIIAAHLVLHWDKFTGSDKQFNEGAAELLSLVSKDVRGWVVRWWIVGWVLLYTVLMSIFFSSVVILPWLDRRVELSAIPVEFLASTRFVYPLFAIGFAGMAAYGFLRRSHRTQLLARCYRKWLFKRSRVGSSKWLRFRGIAISALAPEEDIPRPELHILTTSMTDGELYSISAKGLHGQTGQAAVKPGFVPTDRIDVAKAVTASSAFPPLFPPVLITAQMVDRNRSDFDDQALTDGGVYDNSGLHLLRMLTAKDIANAAPDAPPPLKIVSNAGKPFVSDMPMLKLITARAVRTTDIQMKRLVETELKLDERPQVTAAHELGGKVQVVLDIEDCDEGDWPLSPDLQRRISTWRTDLDRFNDEEVHLLILHGYVVAKRQLAEILGDDGQRQPWTPIKHLEHAESPELIAATEKSSQRRFRVLRLKDPASWWLVALLACNVSFLSCLILRNTVTTPEKIAFSRVGFYDPTGTDDVMRRITKQRQIYSLMLNFKNQQEVYGVTGPLRESLNQRPLSAFRCRLHIPESYTFVGFVFLHEAQTERYHFIEFDVAKPDEFAIPACASLDSLLVIGILRKSDDSIVADISKEQLDSGFHLERVNP